MIITSSPGEEGSVYRSCSEDLLTIATAVSSVVPAGHRDLLHYCPIGNLI